MPTFNSFVYVRLLLSFVSAKQQENHLFVGLSVIDAVSWPLVDTEFPYSVTDRLAVSERSGRNPVHASGNASYCDPVPQTVKPFLVQVLTFRCQVMDNLIH
jgi:hypothetical protein